MSQAHLFETHDEIFSIFAYVQRQECHHQALKQLSTWGYLFLINAPFPKFTGGVYWRGAFKREWAFIKENAVTAFAPTSNLFISSLEYLQSLLLNIDTICSLIDIPEKRK